jgi:hypothetical protein
MSDESDKPRVDPNATIQLDSIEGGLEGIELSDAPPKVSGPSGGIRLPPPPLPAEQPTPSAPPTTAGGKSVGRTLAYMAMLLAVVGLAMAAGLSVGNRARAKWGAAAAPSATLAHTASATEAPAASARVLTLPPIEIKGP